MRRFESPIHPSLHPFSMPAYSCIQGPGGLHLVVEPIPAAIGWETGKETQWTSRHFITGPHGETNDQSVNVEFPIHLTFMFVDCGRKQSSSIQLQIPNGGRGRGANTHHPCARDILGGPSSPLGPARLSAFCAVPPRIPPSPPTTYPSPTPPPSLVPGAGPKSSWLSRRGFFPPSARECRAAACLCGSASLVMDRTGWQVHKSRQLSSLQAHRSRCPQKKIVISDASFQEAALS